MSTIFKNEVNKLFQLRNIKYAWKTAMFISNETKTDLINIKTPKPIITSIDTKNICENPTTNLPTMAEPVIKDAIITPVLNAELSVSVPFNEVPGPRILQHIAKVWSVLPVIGTQVTTSTLQYMLGAGKLYGSQLTWGKNSRVFRWLLDEYGPVVRLQGPFGGDVVILSRAEDALSVFASEGRYPVRSCLDCIETYRLKYRQYKHAGPFVMYGEEWERLRTQVENSLKNSTMHQLKTIDEISRDFVLQIKKIRNRQEEVPHSFDHELFKWSLETLCAVMLGSKMGFMGPTSAVGSSEPARLLAAFYGATDAIRKCESGLHLWKFIETPAWKSLVKNCDTIDSILSKHIRDAEVTLRAKQSDIIVPFTSTNLSLLESMLLQKGMLPEDVLTVFLDMMLIGVNTISHSMAFLIYHLARCPRAQRILADEVRAAPERVDPEMLANLKYLNACIKESLRLKPPMPFLSRVLTKDIIVHNYRIPKGTVILIATFLSSLREEHFDDALKFVPERWLASDVEPDSSFACIPFGFGPKACLAKNLANMQLSILLFKLVRNFKIQYHYGDIYASNKLLTFPEKPLRFRFQDRPIF